MRISIGRWAKITRRKRRVGREGFLLALALLTSIQCSGRSPSPKEQAEALMKSGIPLAQKLLAERGEFHPFGAVMTASGEIQQVAPYAASDPPPSLDVIDLLEEKFRKGAESEQYRAAAVFVKVRVQPPSEAETTDALEVILEHREGYCVNVFVPYSRSERGEVSYRAPFAVPRSGSVFPNCGVKEGP